MVEFEMSFSLGFQLFVLMNIDPAEHLKRHFLCCFSCRRNISLPVRKQESVIHMEPLPNRDSDFF